MGTEFSDLQGIFGADDDGKTSTIEFGIDQAIITRCDAGKKKAKAGGLSSATFNTPQSKGLEFNALLICNFCTDSPVFGTDGRGQVAVKGIYR